MYNQLDPLAPTRKKQDKKNKKPKTKQEKQKTFLLAKVCWPSKHDDWRVAITLPMKTRGACHTMALPFTLKKVCIFKAKQEEEIMETQILLRQNKKNYGNSNIIKAKQEELWKLKYYFTIAKIRPNLQNNPLKQNPNPSRSYYNSIITNPQVSTQAKIYHLSKILI